MCSSFLILIGRKAAKSFSSVVLSSLPSFANLTSVSFPLAILTNLIFDKIYYLPVLRSLDLLGVVRTFQIAVDLDSTRPGATRSVELAVHKLVSGERWDSFSLLERVVDLIHSRHSVAVRSLHLQYHFLSTQTFLTFTPLPRLSHLRITSPPTAFLSAIADVEQVLQVQTALRILILETDAAEEGFEFGDHT